MPRQRKLRSRRTRRVRQSWRARRATACLSLALLCACQPLAQACCSILPNNQQTSAAVGSARDSKPSGRTHIRRCKALSRQ